MAGLLVDDPGRFRRKHRATEHSCYEFYQQEREKRKCSCGRDGIGLSRYGNVCSSHNRFPTQVVTEFPPMPLCPCAKGETK